MSNTVKLAPISNREDYIEEFQAFDEDDALIDLTGATIVFSVADKDTGSEILSATTAAGTITISTTTATVNISVDTMRGVAEAKEYNVGCTVVINSVTSQLFVGTVQIYDGIVP